eukprot:c7888_g1_i1.p2 GENE.c7888_g1_i1~~c7888_g1_i1.p2  ORF type:complete len:362 (-),score=110.41 c7888_g1_i1:216-1301(-)
MSGRGKAKGSKISKSTKAGLIFPAARVHRQLKARRVADRISVGGAVYMAAVLEYLAAEVLELSGNCAKDMKKTRITPRHILLAFRADSEFDEMMTKHNVTIAEGGVPPHIMQQLLPKEKLSTSSISTSQQSDGAKKIKAIPKVKKATTKKAIATATFTSAAASSNASKAVHRTATIESLGSKKLFLGQNLKIVKANIGKYDKAEAIVHPTNASLSTGGMVGQELMRYGGAAFQNELAQNHTTLGMTQCCITGAGDLEAQHVIHCHSPSWNKAGTNAIAQLKQTIDNILKLADKKNIASVALPSIGSGHNGFPKDEAARAILQAIDSYFQSIMSSSLKEVHFVLFDDESVDVYNTVYSHEFP